MEPSLIGGDFGHAGRLRGYLKFMKERDINQHAVKVGTLRETLTDVWKITSINS